MEQYVKGFQRFHAGEDVRPVTYCKFLRGVSHIGWVLCHTLAQCEPLFRPSRK